MTRKLQILFVNPDTSDYLSVSLLHGLRQMPGVDVLDYPESSYSYEANRSLLLDSLRGRGFTLFFNQCAARMKRVNIKLDHVVPKVFDLIVFGDIKSNFGLYFEYFPYLEKGRTAVLDGSDAPSLFRDGGEFWRRPYYWFIPKPQCRFPYFKREWIPDEVNVSRFMYLLPRRIAALLPQHKYLMPISFSIPAEKIVKDVPRKSRRLASHIVDEEIRRAINGPGTDRYIFTTEDEYYADLQSSKFGVTTKRAGWDCLRHYEIAANGAVICFRDLVNKPKHCAPHGLVPDVNCISYSSYDDLMRKTQTMSDERYVEMQRESLAWVRDQTTVKRAAEFLVNLGLRNSDDGSNRRLRRHAD
jgi:hypothetical protein